MEKATEATTPTAPTPSADQDPIRASYQRAKALADRLVDQTKVLPDTVEVRRELGTDTYGVRLHCGTGLAAGRGVLETAAATDTEVTREEVRTDVVWIEAHVTIDGVPLIARALTNTADADQLLQETADTSTAPADEDVPEKATEATQPMPTLGTSPAEVTVPVKVPAIFTVRPLAAVKAAGSEAGQ